MTDDHKKYISTCPKCEEMYPTVIFTCRDCNCEVAYAKGFTHITPSTFSCHECYEKMCNSYQKLVDYGRQKSYFIDRQNVHLEIEKAANLLKEINE